MQSKGSHHEVHLPCVRTTFSLMQSSLFSMASPARFPSLLLYAGPGSSTEQCVQQGRPNPASPPHCAAADNATPSQWQQKMQLTQLLQCKRQPACPLPGRFTSAQAAAAPEAMAFFARRDGGWVLVNSVSSRTPRPCSARLLPSWVAPACPQVQGSASPFVKLHGIPVFQLPHSS